MLTCAALSGCAFSAVCPNGGPLSCFALSAAASSAPHPDSGFLAGRRSWLVRGIADDLDFRPGSADIEGSWRFCRKVRPSSDGNPRRMASCRCRCGAVVDARGSNAREPVPRSEADRHRNRRRLGRSCLRGQSTPGALAPRPRRRLFGVERQASQSGGDDQAAASPSQAPSEELDVRLTGTNPSADRKRGPGSRLVTQGAPAHLKVRPPRAPRGQDVFLEWGRACPLPLLAGLDLRPAWANPTCGKKCLQPVRSSARRLALAIGRGGSRTSDPRGDRAVGTFDEQGCLSSPTG
jgi:hypothetical protein